jgi:hypothetical protein
MTADDLPNRPNIEPQLRALCEALGVTDYARVRRVEVFPTEATIEVLMLKDDHKFVGPEGGIAVEIHRHKVRT